MFRAIIFPILRSTRLCVTACGKCTHEVAVAGSLEAETSRITAGTSWVHYNTSCNTQSSYPEDGQNNCPKHVELIGIINKLLLLHLVGCLYYLYHKSMYNHLPADESLGSKHVEDVVKIKILF